MASFFDKKVFFIPLLLTVFMVSGQSVQARDGSRSGGHGSHGGGRSEGRAERSFGRSESRSPSRAPERSGDSISHERPTRSPRDESRAPDLSAYPSRDSRHSERSSRDSSRERPSSRPNRFESRSGSRSESRSDTPRRSERVTRTAPDGRRTFRSQHTIVHDRPYSRGDVHYVQRTTIHNHHTTVYNYRPYYWGPHRFYSYVPRYTYGPRFNVWIGLRWGPVSYRWWWYDDPWYIHAGYYWHPYPYYYGPSYWITDYVIADILAEREAENAAAARAEAREEREEAYQAAINENIKSQVKEQVEAELKAREKQESVPIEKTLRSNYMHVVTRDINVSVNNSNENCALTSGDIIRTVRTPAQGDEVVSMMVVSSKKGSCAPNTRIFVSLDDLQDMKNNFSESIDKGLVKLQAEQGKNGLPAAPENAKIKAEETLTPDEKNQAVQEAEEEAKKLDDQ